MTPMELRALFDGAQRLEPYVAAAKSNQDLWIATMRRAVVPAELIDRAKSFDATRYVLVMAEDWCGDAVNSVPYVAALATMAPHVELRVVTRDDNPALMDSHLTNGSRSIPVVIVMDEEFNELGWWGPRPTALQAWVLSPEAKALSKDDRYREIRRWYARDRGRTIVAEVLDLLERTRMREDVAA